MICDQVLVEADEDIVVRNIVEMVVASLFEQGVIRSGVVPEAFFGGDSFIFPAKLVEM